MYKKKSDDKIVWGCDPEFAVLYGAGFVMPPVYFRNYAGYDAEPHEKHPVFLRIGDTMIHEDGAAFEMSVRPSHSWESMFDSIQEAKQAFKERFAVYKDICVPELASIPTAKWEIPRWKDEDDEFAWATRFGCDPDMDVFNTKVECRTEDASEHPYRYFGGHIHMSGMKEIVDNPLVAVQCMAATAGLASIAFSPYPDLERLRLYRYGKPGKFRVQNYGPNKYSPYESGIEYRTPSTAWSGSKSLAESVFSWARFGLEGLLAGGLFERVAVPIMDDAKKAITSVDQALSKDLLHYMEQYV